MKTLSVLVDGRIPAFTDCPFRDKCPSGKTGCKQTGKDHSIAFSCAFARGFDLMGDDFLPIANRTIYFSGKKVFTPSSNG